MELQDSEDENDGGPLVSTGTVGPVGLTVVLNDAENHMYLVIPYAQDVGLSVCCYGGNSSPYFGQDPSEIVTSGIIAFYQGIDTIDLHSPLFLRIGDHPKVSFNRNIGSFGVYQCAIMFSIACCQSHPDWHLKDAQAVQIGCIRIHIPSKWTTQRSFWKRFLFDPHPYQRPHWSLIEMTLSKTNQIIGFIADTKVPHDMASTLHTQRL